MRTKFIALLFVLMFAVTGCVASQSGGQGEQPPSGASTGASQSDFFYYHFDDVLVPRDMKLDTNDSFVHGVGHQKSGVLVFSGRVEFISLTNAFIRNMENDGWSLRFQFNSPRTILLFTKPTRFCIVNITDGRTSTDLEIWVSPRPDGGKDTLDHPLPMMQAPAAASVPAPAAPAPAPLKEEGLDQ